MTSPDPRTSALRRIAADISWSRTPDRAQRTEPARRASPARIEYWEARIRAEGVVREADIPKAAASAHRAHMRRMSLKAAVARAKKARRKARRAA